jgi:hypothetical protein
VAIGSTASAINQAVDAILTAQTPPLPSGPGTTFPSVSCADVSPPFGGASGYTCTLEVQVGSSAPVTITLPVPSPLAQALYTAIVSAGTMPCFSKASTTIDLANLSVTSLRAEYDDGSNDQPFDPPNVVVQGADAQAILDAFSSAGIDDCDPTRYVFLECNRLGGSASCGAQFMPLDMVGSSDLVPLCFGAGQTWPGPSIDAAASTALWQSILTAATDAGFQPTSGTLAETTVINARYFTWDGTNLTFSLVQGNATPPAPPPDAGGP